MVLFLMNYAIGCDLNMRNCVVYAQSMETTPAREKHDNHRLLCPLNLINRTLISYEPSCNQAVKLKQRLSLAFEHSKSNTDYY